jgi:hypothetical protein
MLRYVAISYFALGTVLHAQTVVVDTNIVAIPVPEGIHFQISKDGQPPPFHTDACVECDTEVTFQYDGAKLKTSSILLDEGSDWFLVQPGDIFSAATINAGQFPPIVNVTPEINGSEVTVGPGDFYLCLRTGRGFANSRPNRNAYGWVHLRPENGMLTMVENVMSYNSRGIIVGTTIVVPEPCARVLVGLGISLLAVFTRRDRVAW